MIFSTKRKTDHSREDFNRLSEIVTGRISIVITDLDDTLYDWLFVWYVSFKAMLDQILRETGIGQEVLIPAFRAIHRKAGTSEYLLSTEELANLLSKYTTCDSLPKLAATLSECEKARIVALRLYPSVLETLLELKRRGCLIVGCTDSQSCYARYRLCRLGLDAVLHYAYAPSRGQRTSDFSGVLRWKTQYRSLPDSERKPNPTALLRIVRELGASPWQAIYIGDSLLRDVRMAKRAGIVDVWAKYGAATFREEYELLRQVSHWTDREFAEERALNVEQVSPSHVLERRFEELLRLFEFERFDSQRIAV